MKSRSPGVYFLFFRHSSRPVCNFDDGSVAGGDLAEYLQRLDKHVIGWCFNTESKNFPWLDLYSCPTTQNAEHQRFAASQTKTFVVGRDACRYLCMG
jgi:hypothetical protein